MKRKTVLLSMVAAFAVGVGLARAEKHEHNYSEDSYETFPCCLIYENSECEKDEDGNRACQRRCSSWGRKMINYEKCWCGARRQVSSTRCRDDL